MSAKSFLNNLLHFIRLAFTEVQKISLIYNDLSDKAHITMLTV